MSSVGQSSASSAPAKKKKNKNRLPIFEENIRTLETAKDIGEELWRSLGQYARENKVYIGIASGESPKEAMRARYRKKKREVFKITRMVCVFQSDCQFLCRKIEQAMIHHANKVYGRSGVFNEGPGGEGANSEGPNFYVYVAMRRKRK